MEHRHLRVGTRGSQLALLQTSLVTDALQKVHPEITVEVVTIQTQGDKNLAPIPLSSIGKAWFTAEIERALTDGDIDLAVHSLKDLPMEISDQLPVRTVLQRGDPRDVFISKTGVKVADLPKGAVVGTDSGRRRCQLLQLRPDIIVKSIRGNVQTRLKKMHEQDYDGLVLAAAGLDRLQMLDIVTEFFDPTIFIPSPGQGALAAQLRHDDSELSGWLKELEDEPTVLATQAERAFSEAVGGGCKMPVGCYAQVEEERITLHGMIGNLDGSSAVCQTIGGPLQQAIALARDLAEAISATCDFPLEV